MLRLLRGFYARLRDRIRRYRARRRIPYTEYLVRYFITYRMTASGRAVAFTLILVNVLAWYNLQIPVYQLVVGLSFLMVTDYLFGHFRRAQVILDGGIPEKATAGVMAEARYTLANGGTRDIRELGGSFFWIPLGRQHLATRYSFEGAHGANVTRSTDAGYLPNSVRSPEAMIESLRPGESTELTVDLMFDRRGIYQLPRLRVYSQFPFNLFRTPAKVFAEPPTNQRNTVMVLPDFIPASGIDLPASRIHQPGGISLTSDIGESPEYIGSREYRTGDNVRRIDFRGWARHGSPVVREYQEEYFCRVAVIMDTYVKRGESDAMLEGTIQLTAAIAHARSDGEYIVDLFAAGPDLYVFRTGRSTAHFENILEILACLDRSETNPFVEIEPALREAVSMLSTAVFVFMDWDEAREQIVQMAQEFGCSVKVYIVRDGETTLAIEGAKAMVESIRVFTPAAVARGAYEVL